MKNQIWILWRYRGFVFGAVKRDFQAKYRNSLLGSMWNIINPLAMIVVYTLIFSQVMKARLPGLDTTFGYGIYLCAGVLTWGFFTEITTRLQNVFIENANLLKKINFPRLCLPIIVVVNALLNFSIVFGLFTVFLLLSGNFPGWVYLALIPLILVQAFFSIGLGMVLGVLNVFFRDVGQLFGVLVTFWFWLTPIVYPIDILPRELQPFLAWNPMTGFVQSVQGVLVHGVWPHWPKLTPMLVSAVVLFILGGKLLRRYTAEMVDEL